MKEYHNMVYIVGPPESGKSSILSRWLYNEFSCLYHATFLFDNYKTSIYEKEDLLANINFMDFSGQPIYFNQYKKMHIEPPEAIIIVFDGFLDNPANKIIEWIKFAREFNLPDDKIILVLNKIDLLKNLHTSKELIQEVTKSLSWTGKSQLISAKSNYGIKRLLRTVTTSFNEEMKNYNLCQPAEKTKRVNLANIDTTKIRTVQIIGALLVITYNDGTYSYLPNPCLTRPKQLIDDATLFNEFQTFESTCPINGIEFDPETGNPINPMLRIPDGVHLGIRDDNLYISCSSMLGCWLKKEERPKIIKNKLYSINLATY